MQGQTQGKARARGAGPAGGGQAAGEYEDGPHSFGRGSPPIPGSPLTYSPQVPMEPISKGEEFGRGGSVYGQSEFAGWGAHPKLVPTVIVWAHGGNHVELEGSFDSWTQRYTMQRSGKDFTLVKLVPPGVYQVRGQLAHHGAAAGRSNQRAHSCLAWPTMPSGLLSSPVLLSAFWSRQQACY